MSTAVNEILARIDRLGPAEQEELQAALRLRARAQWEPLADQERKQSAERHICNDDVNQAVQELRYGKKAS